MLEIVIVVLSLVVLTLATSLVIFFKIFYFSPKRRDRSEFPTPEGEIYDAYRPQSAVDHFKVWAQDADALEMKPYFYPEVEKSELFTRGYISAQSGHSRGSTIDLTIVDMMTGCEVDMGGGFDYFGEESHRDYIKTLTQEQIKNRRLLRKAMEDNGFTTEPEEWWHFTLENEPYPDTYFDFPIVMPRR